MRRLILITVLMAIAAGCTKKVPVYIGRLGGESPAGMNAANLAAPASPEVNDICDVDSLATQTDDLRVRIDRLRQELFADVDKRHDEYQSNGGNSRYYVSRVNRFDGEIDAAYRNVTSSCRAYSRCMQNNFYSEGECRSTLSSWERSRDDFADLARELREIEAEVKRDLINRTGRYSRRGAYLNKKERCDCSQSVGGVFANCCDRDSDSAYHRKKVQ